MFGPYLNAVREKAPLVHNITNPVTMNDCANITLAAGASPIMANDPLESAEVTAVCRGLNVNIGMLNQSTVQAMYRSIAEANKKNIPVLVDPVGAGVSQFRRETLSVIFSKYRITAVRGNLSEIRSIITGQLTSHGVDAEPQDVIDPDRYESVIEFARYAAGILHCVVVITGVIDIIADEQNAFCIKNGHPMMSRVTGTGCMLSSLTAAFLAANPDEPLQAAAAAVAVMGYAGEIAYSRMKEYDGNASYRTYLIDAVCNMTPQQLEEGENYEMH